MPRPWAKAVRAPDGRVGIVANGRIAGLGPVAGPVGKDAGIGGRSRMADGARNPQRYSPLAPTLARAISAARIGGEIAAPAPARSMTGTAVPVVPGLMALAQMLRDLSGGIGPYGIAIVPETTGAGTGRAGIVADGMTGGASMIGRAGAHSAVGTAGGVRTGAMTGMVIGRALATGTGWDAIMRRVDGTRDIADFRSGCIWAAHFIRTNIG